MSNASDSSHTTNAFKTNVNTWADCVEEFPSNLMGKNAFSNDGGANFF